MDFGEDDRPSHEDPQAKIRGKKRRRSQGDETDEDFVVDEAKDSSDAEMLDPMDQVEASRDLLIRSEKRPRQLPPVSPPAEAPHLPSGPPVSPSKKVHRKELQGGSTPHSGQSHQHPRIPQQFVPTSLHDLDEATLRLWETQVDGISKQKNRAHKYGLFTIVQELNSVEGSANTGLRAAVSKCRYNINDQTVLNSSSTVSRCKTMINTIKSSKRAPSPMRNNVMF